jgi:hypothetical protein
VKLFLQFALGSFPLALPTTDLHIEPISPKTYLDEGLDGGDLLAMEAPTLLRKFAVGAHPTLSNGRRLKSGLMTTVGAPWNASGPRGGSVARSAGGNPDSRACPRTLHADAQQVGLRRRRTAPMAAIRIGTRWAIAALAGRRLIANGIGC